GDVAARKILLDPLEEAHIDGHKVFEASVLRTIFDHPDLVVPLNDLGFDLADLLMEKGRPVLRSAENLFTRFLDAFRAKRVRLSGPAQDRLGLLPRFQKRLFRPFGREGRIDIETIEELQRIECNTGTVTDRSVDILHHALGSLNLDVPIAGSVI